MTAEWKLPEGPYRPTWLSLSNYDVPHWYRNGKFGIFIHWGVYSVPAYGNEWYPRNMYEQGSPEFEYHVGTFGLHTEFGYKDFIPHLTAKNFDPDQWAELFRRAGARFVVPVAEHHDGFAMYNCRYNRWSSVQMGPKRDIIGELAKAVRKQWLVFGLSSHRAEHWWFFNGGTKFDCDVQNPKLNDLYGPAQPRDTQPNEEFLEDWLLRCCELVDRYKPQLFWFDWWIEQPAFEPYLKKFAAYYYNRASTWNRGVAINYKKEAYPKAAAVYDVERGQLKEISPTFWQTDTGSSKNSWGYIKDQEYKTAKSIIGDLIDIVSKNGALLLNIGPRPDGSIPEPEEELLRQIGAWLARNGEAIYDSRPWKVFGEGPTRISEGSFTDTERREFAGADVRFTTRGSTLYAFVLGWPKNGEVRIKSLGRNLRLYGGRIGSVELLGYRGRLKWSHSTSHLGIKLPAEKPDEHAYVLKITPKEDST